MSFANLVWHPLGLEGTGMTPLQARARAEAMGLKLRFDLPAAELSDVGPVVELSLDRAGADYIGRADQVRHGKLVTWLHRSLRGFLSDFDINGYLGTYPMHVLSAEQWRLLLPLQDDGAHLLDVGAGRGDVTSCLAPLFSQVTTSETSAGMARRLRRQGYQVLDRDLAKEPPEESYDAVSLLNVLDRCDRPLSLLGAARGVLKEGGLLVIALVLPYRPFVYDGGVSRGPSERLPISSTRFEDAAREFIQLALLSLGLTVVAISRAPYLSGGDAERPLYELDDLIVVCRALGPPPPILGKPTERSVPQG